MSAEHLQQKQAVIDEIRDKLSRATSAVVIDYKGITVSEADAMRKKLREAEVDYKVYKNTLVNRAVEGTDYAELKNVLFGPSAFAFSYEDATVPARTLNGIMKEYKKMAFKAGVVEGVFYDAAGIQSVAETPSREELLAKFLGSIQSPVSKFVRTLAAIAEAKSEGGEPAPVAEDAKAEETLAEDSKPVEASEAAPESDAADEAPAETPAEEAKANESEKSPSQDEAQ
ncbi:MAG: 50S ribosomal protein L10 [Clostridiales Family XIII bacterium]|jgi:large subunit ribosomal protein L10|nr:50S ribosomal protein L10 [Clostridiales Family XIII bacterium]